MEIIVTDLTRFQRKDILCMAGLTLDGQHCIRPMRPALPGYLTFDECKKYSLLPGTVLFGEFTRSPSAEAPHVEDCHFKNMRVSRRASSEEFYRVLDQSSFTNLSTAFDTPIFDKVLREAPRKSIITLKVSPHAFKIVRDRFNNSKIKAHVTDDSGIEIAFLSITDLGLSDFIGNPITQRMNVDCFNSFIRKQKEIYLRIGLSREYQSESGRRGFWLQVNGVYTFPDFQQILRSY